ncbi:MAG: tyrosine--tRNA ligase [Gemmatimonadales bacterium]
MTDLLTTLRERGLVHDCTPGLANRLARGAITSYVGFDPTADSLHVGNLVPVMALAWLQRLGGQPIVVVGGGTGLVGDPSGKRGERPLLSVAEIEANAAAIRTQLSRFLAFEGPGAARMLDNATWLRPLLLMEFLRDIGKHFTINYMLQKESVKARMDSGISFTEFAYMLVQAYDFDHLYTTYDCELQMGGSDQWGNITAGIELIARRRGGEAQGLVCPLLTAADGTKFGKSEGENVWLDPAKTSPYRFYQFWVNVDDRDVERLLRIFTFLPNPEVEALMERHRAAPEQRIPHRQLAGDVTTRVHGAEECRRAVAASGILFGGGNIREADPSTLEVVLRELPPKPVSRAKLESGSLLAVDALVAAGSASTKAEAKRGIESGSYYLNDERIGENRPLTSADLLPGGYLALRRGRKHYAFLRVE